MHGHSKRSNGLPAATAVLVEQQLPPVMQAVVLLLVAAGQALTAAAQRAPAPAPSSLGAYVDSAGRINSCYAIDGIASPAFAANVSYTDAGSVGACTMYFTVSNPSVGIFWHPPAALRMPTEVCVASELPLRVVHASFKWSSSVDVVPRLWIMLVTPRLE